MSAEIIQLGNRERRVSAPTLRPSGPQAAPVRRVKRRRSTVRLVFDNELIEVDFCDDDVQRVCTVQYRVSADGVKEIKRNRWQLWRWHHHHDGPLDPAVERAARHARKSDSEVDLAAFYKAALAPLLKRREKLAAMLQKVDATIVGIQQHISN